LALGAYKIKATMNKNPTKFSLHSMYKSFINKWGADYAPDFKGVEDNWIEITSGLSDEKIIKMSYLITEELTGFPGTIDLNKYASAAKNDVEVEPSNDALEIAASVFYVNDNAELESNQEVTNEVHILPRKSMFLIEASKWVNDSYEKKGKWQHVVRRIQKTYNT